VHDKIYYIKAFAVGLAIGAKTVCRLGFIVNLHAWGLIIVERATDTVMFVGFQVVILQHGCHAQPLFYLAYFHSQTIF
jgi:hypothetical protein